jgi:hypothetical protein
MNIRVFTKIPIRQLFSAPFGLHSSLPSGPFRSKNDVSIRSTLHRLAEAPIDGTVHCV